MAITDQYLRAIEAMQEVEPEALADFLVVAARLLYIKSRGLLPQPVVEEEEEEEKQSEALIQQVVGLSPIQGRGGRTTHARFDWIAHECAIGSAAEWNAGWI